MRPNPLPPTLLAAALLAALPAPTQAATGRNLVVMPAAGTATASAERRLALVIGNAGYADAPLQNPVNDARAMARALEAAGFEVMLHTDADQRTLLTALREFGQRLRGGGTGLFYFAGHGMQIKGRNYLIPVGADIRREDEVAYQSMDVQAVLDKMDSAANGTNLVILDACRNNPFARSFRSSQQGLAPVDAPVGTLVAFATSPGAVASDGSGDNGLYTRHLLQALAEPGRKVEEVFKQVRTAVRRDSQGQQVPWESTSLEGDFYFHPPTAVAATPAAPVPAPDPLAALDDAPWETVRDSASAVELQAYLRRFPAGRHAALAQVQLAALSSMAPPPVPAPAATVPAAPPASGTATAGAAQTQDAAAFPNATERLATTLPLPPGAEPEPERESRPLSADGLPAAAERQALGLPFPPGTVPEWEPGRSSASAGAAHHGGTGAAVQVNAHGFAIGDYYTYVVHDRIRRETSGVSNWRIGQIEDEGVLVVSGGAVKLDAFGRLLHRSSPGFGSETWTQAMTVAWPGMAVGDERPIDTVRRRVDVEGRVSEGRFSGKAKVVARERITVPAGEFDTLKVQVRTRGDHERGDGARWSVYWSQTYWWAPALGLYVAMESDERVDGRLEGLWRRELFNYEVQRARAQVAGASR